MTKNEAVKNVEPKIIDNTLASRLHVRPMYFELGFSDCPKIYARACVVDKLLLALHHLPPHLGLLVWDAYRPRVVQGKLFEWMKGEIRNKYPTLKEEGIISEAKKYMSQPSVVGEAYCPPHLSGGAVDLTLFNLESGEALEMGTPFDDCTVRAHAMHFESGQALSPKDETIRVSRSILRDAMLAVGFVIYEYEWWHFDYGDCFWSKQTGLPTLFGPLFGDLEWPER